MQEKKHSLKIEYLLYLLIALTTLFLILFPSYGNDHVYWMYRLNGMVYELQANGLCAFPTRILSNSFYGYGYGAPLFYGDIFLVLPALFVWAGLPLIQGYCLISAEIWLCRFFSAYFSARYFLNRVPLQRIDKHKDALAFAFFYQFFPYMVEDIMYRSAMGEAAASVVLPLIFASACALLFSDKASCKDSLLLAIGMSLLVCSHTLSTIMVCFALGITCLVYIKRIVIQKRFLKWGLAIITTIFLSAYWTLPFCEQMMQHDVTVNHISQNGSLAATRLRITELICPTTLYSIYHEYKTGKPLTFSSYWPNLVLYFLFVAVFLCIRKKEKFSRSLPTRLVVYSALLVLFSCSRTILTWADKISFIRVLQFPWRVFIFFSLFLAIAFAYYFREADKAWIKHGLVILFACSTIVICILPIKWMTTEAGWGLHDLLEVGVENKADTLYLPGNALSIDPLERGDLIVCNDSNFEFAWERKGNGLSIYCSSNAYSPDFPTITLELPLYYYYGYTAFCDQKNVNIYKSENGLVEVSFPSDLSGTIRVYYGGTKLQKFSTFLSLISWLILIISFIIFIGVRHAKKN